MASLMGPDFERKGSLSLRSNHMNYARATLHSTWNQAREAEPKDYDINKAPMRDLGKATYHRIGNVTDGSIPKTTYQDEFEQILLKNDFQEREIRKPMVTTETLEHAFIDRDTGLPTKGFGSVLPRHNPEYSKRHLETTHQADFGAPYPFTRAEDQPPDFPDHSVAYKHCFSQFTDTTDYRRPGRNTWRDESGVYANTHYRQQITTKTNTIPSVTE